MSVKKAIVLANVGTPVSPEVGDVRRYLSQFLNDGRVIDLPWLARKLLVNLIIVPFRASKSSKLYKQLWTEDGSPLVYYGDRLVKKVQKKAGDNADIFLAMRYGNPSLKNVLTLLKEEHYTEIVVVPLFPQYASSTTGTINQLVMTEVAKWDVMPALRFVGQFYNNPNFISAFVKKASAYNLANYDHIIFSYHGLPNRHVERTHPNINVGQCTCETTMPAHGKSCYKATCYETTRLLAKALNLSANDYSVGFQSRLSKKWLTPFTDELVIKLAHDGAKKVLILAPAFVTDCLETIIELGIEYNELFVENGGEKLQLVSSLNDSDLWSDTLWEMVK